MSLDMGNARRAMAEHVPLGRFDGTGARSPARRPQPGNRGIDAMTPVLNICVVRIE